MVDYDERKAVQLRPNRLHRVKPGEMSSKFQNLFVLNAIGAEHLKCMSDVNEVTCPRQ